jgi:hypothetical protein
MVVGALAQPVMVNRRPGFGKQISSFIYAENELQLSVTKQIDHTSGTPGHLPGSH